jgi:hypothetical protein
MIKQEDKATLKGIGFMFLFIMALSITSAYESWTQNTNLNFSITSNFATSCTLTTINSPDGVITINQDGTVDGQTFTFSILGSNYSSLGSYCHNIVCTDGTDYTTGQECREITSTGDNSNTSQTGIIFAYGIFIALLIGLGFSFSKEKWKIRGFFFTLGLFIAVLMINSIRVIAGMSSTLTTMTTSAMIIGIIAVSFMAIYLLIYYTIELIHYFKNKKEMKWKVSDNPA